MSIHNRYLSGNTKSSKHIKMYITPKHLPTLENIFIILIVSEWSHLVLSLIFRHRDKWNSLWQIISSYLLVWTL